jgi:hypothetical protein
MADSDQYKLKFAMDSMRMWLMFAGVVGLIVTYWTGYRYVAQLTILLLFVGPAWMAFGDRPDVVVSIILWGVGSYLAMQNAGKIAEAGSELAPSALAKPLPTYGFMAAQMVGAVLFMVTFGARVKLIPK